MLLSYGLWQRRFDSDPRVIGRLLTLNDSPVTVIGVMPPTFDFATVFAPASRVDLFLPYPLTEEANNRGNELAMIGRLKLGSTLQSARAEMQVLGPRIQRREPDRNFKPIVSNLADHVSERLRPALLVLAFAVCTVMLIVCANLSNLLLARMATRQKEMAIRASLGARRLRLIRQTLTESILLSSCGAIIGLVLAVLGTQAITHLTTLDIPLLASVRCRFWCPRFHRGCLGSDRLDLRLNPGTASPGGRPSRFLEKRRAWLQPGQESRLDPQLSGRFRDRFRVLAPGSLGTADSKLCSPARRQNWIQARKCHGPPRRSRRTIF